MLFHTHVYFTKKVDNDLDPLKIVGSFLPDLPFTGIIDWADLHEKNNILNFFEYVRKNSSDNESLLKGINYHNTLDFFTHIKYLNFDTGYAYKSRTEEIIKLTHEALNLPLEKARGTAHSIIECAINYQILNEDPSIEILTRDSCLNIDKEKLSFLLSNYFQKNQKAMLESLNKFFSFTNDYDFKTLDGTVEFLIEASKFYLKSQPNKELAKKAIEASIENTKQNYLDFLNYAMYSKDTSIKDSN